MAKFTREIEEWRGIKLTNRRYECENCGIIFKPKIAQQLYCCTKCQKEWQEKEKREQGRFLIFERDNFTCFYCGKKSYCDGVGLHCDHLIPLSKGGKTIASNLVTACQQCNTEKRVMEITVIGELQKEVNQRNKVKGINPNLKIKFG
jgi:hypothetical protein